MPNGNRNRDDMNEGTKFNDRYENRGNRNDSELIRDLYNKALDQQRKNDRIDAERKRKEEYYKRTKHTWNDPWDKR